MSNSKLKHFGRLAILSAAFLWGTSFVIMKNVLSNIPVFYILAIRFCGASLILLPACTRKLRSVDKKYLLGGLVMGTALLLGYVFQTFGLRLTTPGKNAFLTSVYSILVPFLYWMFIRKKPDKYNAAAALLCIAGIGMISLDGDLTIGTGDALTLVCGFFFALHIVATDFFVEGRDPVVLAMLQFAAAGVIALAAALIFERTPTDVTFFDVWRMVYLTFICTAACLLMQVFGQKYTPASQAAVLITLEAVFGALSSVLMYGEVLTLRLALGFALTFCAVVISETKLEFFKRRSGDASSIS